MIDNAKNKPGRQIMIRVVGSGAALTRVSTSLISLDSCILTVLKAFEELLISQDLSPRSCVVMSASLSKGEPLS